LLYYLGITKLRMTACGVLRSSWGADCVAYHGLHFLPVVAIETGLT